MKKINKQKVYEQKKKHTEYFSARCIFEHTHTRRCRSYYKDLSATRKGTKTFLSDFRRNQFRSRLCTRVRVTVCDPRILHPRVFTAFVALSTPRYHARPYTHIHIHIYAYTHTDMRARYMRWRCRHPKDKINNRSAVPKIPWISLRRMYVICISLLNLWDVLNIHIKYALISLGSIFVSYKQRAIPLFL